MNGFEVPTELVEANESEDVFLKGRVDAAFLRELREFRAARR